MALHLLRTYKRPKTSTSSYLYKKSIPVRVLSLTPNTDAAMFHEYSCQHHLHMPSFSNLVEFGILEAFT